MADDKRNVLEILQKALQWLVTVEADYSETTPHNRNELKADIAGLKAVLANMPVEEHAFFTETRIPVLSNLAYARLRSLMEDDGSLSNQVDIELHDVLEAALLVDLLKGIAVKADSIVIRFNKEKEDK